MTVQTVGLLVGYQPFFFVLLFWLKSLRLRILLNLIRLCHTFWNARRLTKLVVKTCTE